MYGGPHSDRTTEPIPEAANCRRSFNEGLKNTTNREVHGLDQPRVVKMGKQRRQGENDSPVNNET